MEKVCHYSISVKGRVQGVGYRAFALKTANQLGIHGYVKNTADGSVQIEAEGDEANLYLFIELCKKGPGWAHVSNIIQSKSPVEGYNEFRVKY